MGQLVAEGVSISVDGTFNPAIFHPAWFEREQLLTAATIAQAELSVVHAELARFSLDWLVVEVSQERMSLETAHGAYREELRSLAERILRRLSHTPVDGLGYRWERRYLLDNGRVWADVAALLRPSALQVAIPGLDVDTMVLNSVDTALSMRSLVVIESAPGTDADVVVMVVEEHDVERESGVGVPPGVVALLAADEWHAAEARGSAILSALERELSLV